CQEVFLRVYQARSRYRATGKFSSWLYQIALNVVRDAARRRHPLLPLVGDAIVDEPCPAEQCQQQDLSNAVSRAVADLPKPLRVVLVLHHYEDMHFEDMALVLQTPASTLRSRFATALRRLRDRLRHLKDAEEYSP